jgi:hypothetical protein
MILDTSFNNFFRGIWSLNNGESESYVLRALLAALTIAACCWCFAEGSSYSTATGTESFEPLVLDEFSAILVMSIASGSPEPSPTSWRDRQVEQEGKLVRRNEGTLEFGRR